MGSYKRECLGCFRLNIPSDSQYSRCDACRKESIRERIMWNKLCCFCGGKIIVANGVIGMGRKYFCSDYCVNEYKLNVSK